MAFNFLRDSAESHFHRALVTGDGTVADPIYTFTGGSTSGFYWDPNSATDNDGAVAVSIGGVKKFEIGASGVTATGTLGCGAITCTSVDAGSGAIATTGTLGCGAINCTSVDASTGNITTTGTIEGNTLEGASLDITGTASADTHRAETFLCTQDGEIQIIGNGDGEVNDAAQDRITFLASGTKAYPQINFGSQANSTAVTGIYGKGTTTGTRAIEFAIEGEEVLTLTQHTSSKENPKLETNGITCTSLDAGSGAIGTTGAITAGGGFVGNADSATTATACTGNANTASTLANARKIGGVLFDGSEPIVLAGVNAEGNQDTTGNAATASALESAVDIGGVSFDGSTGIHLAGVDATGNQDTTGNANTATTLAATKLIGGVPFDGSVNITLAGVNAEGNQNTSGNAATASTALKLTTNPPPSESDGNKNYNIGWVFHGAGALDAYSDNTAYEIRVDNGSGPKYNPTNDTFSATVGTFSGALTCTSLTQTAPPNYRVYVKPTDCGFDNDATGLGGPGAWAVHDSDAATPAGAKGAEGGLQNFSSSLLSDGTYSKRQMYAFCGPFPVYWRPRKYFFNTTDSLNVATATNYGSPRIFSKDIVNVSTTDLVDQRFWGYVNEVRNISEASSVYWHSIDPDNPNTSFFIFKVSSFEYTDVFHGGWVELEYSTTQP